MSLDALQHHLALSAKISSSSTGKNNSGIIAHKVIKKTVRKGKSSGGISKSGIKKINENNYVEVAALDIEAKKKKLADLVHKLNPETENAMRKKTMSKRAAKKLLKLNRKSKGARGGKATKI